MWPKLPPGNNLNLPSLTAEQLTRALAVHFQGAGGLVCDADREIAASWCAAQGSWRRLRQR